MSKIVQGLKKVRALIQDEKNWTQDNFFKDKNGDELLCLQARNFRKEIGQCCIAGACMIVGDFDWSINLIHYSSLLIAIDRELRIENLTDHAGPSAFNDSHTHAEVLDLIDRTIKREENKSVTE